MCYFEEHVVSSDYCNTDMYYISYLTSFNGPFCLILILHLVQVNFKSGCIFFFSLNENYCRTR